MKIHLIAIGGAAMHNLALALWQNGHEVTGSDDEIYNPAAGRLAVAGLLPAVFGWHPEKITSKLEAVILGMHARKDNPELLKAQELGLKIYSYPEFIYQHSINKKRVVIAGSHGKTTTTGMILHVLKYWKRDFDYLVGAMLEGFDTMVKLSDAPIIVVEGDEYLSSPIDLQPKIMHYHPDVAVITGIAWDHINVFPTFENYVQQFDRFVDTMNEGNALIYFEPDENLRQIADKHSKLRLIPYKAFEAKIGRGKTVLNTDSGIKIPLKIFGEHNLANLRAAYLACKEIEVTDEQFFEAIQSFTGAAKRMQTLYKNSKSIAFLDFAHAPSKVKATIAAVKAQYPKRGLIGALELHTFSSLNKKFLTEYAGAMEHADTAIVFFSEHTLAMKKLEPISPQDIQDSFKHPNLLVFTDNQRLLSYLEGQDFTKNNLLLMTSGTFNGLDLKKAAKNLLTK
jgi:UDP-N-acetylmuramate: L-alanyl-gamma-D-glutamyl-meso-diaminopimelate ligase